jgi:hypothetical protein
VTGFSPVVVSIAGTGTFMLRKKIAPKFDV